MAELGRHLDYLEESLAAAVAAPLSVRTTMLAVMLADAFADRLFAAQREEEDVVRFRAAIAARSPALATVFEIAAGRAGLVVEAVSVPIEEYPRLSVEDFMISVYNGHTVQRVRVIGADGRRVDALALIGEAVRELVAAADQVAPAGS